MEHAASNADNQVGFPSIFAASEAPAPTPPPRDPYDARVGIAIVGLGRIAVNEMLPALAQCRHARPVALVTGDRDKGLRIARQYDIPESSVLDYAQYDRLAAMPEVDAVYIALPNSLHAQYTVRAAQAGKHVLCDKPMANSVAECEQMIAACRQAGRKLMIAYRRQYDALECALVERIRNGELGALKEFVSANSQHMGDPAHWRLKHALSGGGALPDIGIYCINAARFLSGEEPVEVIGHTWSTPGDARFTEVEEACQFILRFPSGFTASCTTSYGAHKSQVYRLNGEAAWAEMNPGYAYQGNRLKLARVVDGVEQIADIQAGEPNQFACMIDHFAHCIQHDLDVRTPGEEGLRDQRIIEAIYASARSGQTMRLA